MTSVLLMLMLACPFYIGCEGSENDRAATNWATSCSEEASVSDSVREDAQQGWHDWWSWGPEGDPYQPRRDIIGSESIHKHCDRRRDIQRGITRIAKSFCNDLRLNQMDSKGATVSEILMRKPDPMMSHSSVSSTKEEALGSGDSDFSLESDSGENDDMTDEPMNFMLTNVKGTTLQRRQDEIRRIFDMAFEQRGLSYIMPAEKLALEITRLKINLGFSRSIGQVASKRVKENVSKEVFDTFQILNAKYSRRVSQLKKEANDVAIYTTEKERWNAVSKKIGKYKVLQYEGRNRTDKKSLAADRELDRKAAETWCLLVERFPIRLQKVAATEPDKICTADIEQYSRDLQYEDASQITTAGYIKRYMRRALNKDKSKLLKFSSLRYKYRLHEKNRAREQQVDQKRAAMGLPPIVRS